MTNLLVHLFSFFEGGGFYEVGWFNFGLVFWSGLRYPFVIQTPRDSYVSQFLEKILVDAYPIFQWGSPRGTVAYVQDSDIAVSDFEL